MADQIYQIDVQGFENAARDIQQVEANLKRLNEERAKALKLSEGQKDLTEDQIEQGANLTKEIEKEKQIRQDLQRTIKAGTTEMNNQVGAYQKLNAKLADARAKYKDLAAAGQENTAEAKALNAEVNRMDKEIKKIDASVGQHQRNVGNYSDALSGLGGPIGGAVQGVKGFNTTLKANPILAVVGLIMGLINWLKTLQPVADFITETMGSLNAVFAVLIERMKLLLSGDFRGAFKGIAEDIGAAAKAGREYEKTLKAINDAQQVQNILNSEAEKQIAVLEAQFKDRSKSYAERMEIAKEIARIENENFEKQKQILAETVKNEEIKVRGLLKTRGVNVDLLKTTQDLLLAAQEYALQDKDFEKLAAAQVALNNAEKESLALTERIQSRYNTLNEQRSERAAKEAERVAKELEKEMARVQAFEDQVKKMFEEIDKAAQSFEEQQEIRAINEELKNKLRLEKQLEDERRLYMEKAKAEMEYIAQQQAAGEALRQTVMGTAESIGVAMAQADDNVKKAGKAMLLSMLNILERIVDLKMAEVLARSLAMPDSVFSFGATGVARALAISAISKAAFAFAKAKIGSFAKGGIIGGNLHSAGGTTFYGSDGSAFEAERGELLAIVNRRDTELIGQLGAINGIHGKKFASGGLFVPQVPDGLSAIQQLSAQIRDQRVYVLESDITKKQKHVRVIEQSGQM